MRAVAAWRRSEHANLFHITTEMINIFQTLHMAGVIDVMQPDDRSNMDDVALVILDSQTEVRRQPGCPDSFTQ